MEAERRQIANIWCCFVIKQFINDTWEKRNEVILRQYFVME